VVGTADADVEHTTVAVEKRKAESGVADVMELVLDLNLNVVSMVHSGQIYFPLKYYPLGLF
jgi:hypothetical protein